MGNLGFDAIQSVVNLLLGAFDIIELSFRAQLSLTSFVGNIRVKVHVVILGVTINLPQIYLDLNNLAQVAKRLFSKAANSICREAAKIDATFGTACHQVIDMIA